MMNRDYRTTITAILSMAVIFLAVAFIGCVTPRHIDELRADIGRIEAGNQNSERLVARMDSIIVSGAEADNRLRGNITATMSELQEQISALLENYNELLSKIDQLTRKENVIHIPRSSSGAQTDPIFQGTTNDSPVVTKAIFDCDSTYDEAFILIRRGEYEQSIEGFTTFLTNCPKHESAENAYYWIGESYYAMEKFAEAITQFETLLSQYKSSPNLGRALYKLGRSQQEMGKKSEAIKTFQKLIDDLPETLEASQARERLKDLK